MSVGLILQKMCQWIREPLGESPKGSSLFVVIVSGCGKDSGEDVETIPSLTIPVTVDSSAPATATVGSTAFQSITSSDSLSEYTYTDADPAAVDLDPAVPLPAGSTWCAEADFGDVGCPADLASVTAILIDVPHDITPGAVPTTFTVAVDTDASVAGGDLFTNSYGARIPENELNVISNDVTARVFEPGVTVAVSVLDAEGDPAETTGVKAGAPVTWQVTVTNTGTGPADLTDVTVDSTVAECDLVIGMLAAGEARTYTCTVPAGYENPFTNTATVSGLDPLAETITADDAADVTIVPFVPGISITKQIDNNGAPSETSEIKEGAPVTWLISVENTGETDLTDVAVTDDLAPECARTVGDMAIGAVENYECVVPAGYTTGMTNTAIVTGTAPDGLEPPSNEDTASVKIIPLVPGLTIGKAVVTDDGTAETREVEAGEPVEWAIHVENTGETALNSVAVSDAALPACDRTIGELAVGEIADYTCAAPDGYQEDTVNSVTVTGASGDEPVTNEDTASITIADVPPSTTTPSEMTTTTGLSLSTSTTAAVPSTTSAATTTTTTPDGQAPAAEPPSSPDQIDSLPLARTGAHAWLLVCVGMAFVAGGIILSRKQNGR